MIRGGAVNYSEINLDEKTTGDLICKRLHRDGSDAPSNWERHPFIVYLLDPTYFMEEKNETI